MIEQDRDIAINSINELKALLVKNGIPVEQFGVASAKTISGLLDEVIKGSCQLVLENNELIRLVNSVNIRIYFNSLDKTLYLKEKMQEFADGRIRIRNWLTWSVSEKIEPGENPEQAVIRGMSEELGIHNLTNLTKQEVVNNDQYSPSYPGVKTKYVNNYFNLNLTDEQYKPEGYKEVQPNITTYWEWKEI
jgi:ADP-ribose pyrophosphatase YjhB (NUDIX family)